MPLVTAYKCFRHIGDGPWLLVRKIKQGTVWYPATDDLAGTERYPASFTTAPDTDFSLLFVQWPALDRKFLFATGVLFSSMIFDLLRVAFGTQGTARVGQLRHGMISTQVRTALSNPAQATQNV